MSDPFIGETRMFAGNYAPLHWAFCDGQLLPIAQNTALFSLLGTTYGGNGVTNFALPDLRGRVPLGMGQGPGLSDRFIGESFGSEATPLTAAQIPPHGHREQASTTAASAASGPSAAPAASTTSIYGGGSADLVLAAAAVGAAGGSQPHNNMAPYLGLSFIIALQGVFPPRS